MMRYTQARQFLEALYPELDLDSMSESEAKSHTAYAYDNSQAWSCLLAWIREGKGVCSCGYPCDPNALHCLTCDKIMLDSMREHDFDREEEYAAREMEAEMEHDRGED